MQTSNGVKKTSETKEIEPQRERELQEIDRIAKMLIRRDLALSEIRETRERELQELKQKTHELEETKIALMNMLEDIEGARYGLEEEKNKTLSIITNFTDGLLFFDKENRLVLANPQSEIFFAIASKTILGKTIAELITAPDIGQVLAITNTEVTGAVKNEVSIRDGLILELITIPVIQENKKIGTMIILHDITREKTIEKMKNEFVSLTAHQLRTPLSAIKWTLRMLLDGDLGPLSEEQKNFLQKSYGSNERMIRLINDLLDVARIEEGKFLHKPAPTQLEELVLAIISSFEEKSKRKKIKIKYQPPEKKLPLVKLDSEKIYLAILNLIENAIDYTPENGEVAITLSSDKKEIKFSVQDNGIGIPQNQKKRIFTKFFRGENAVKMETEGTGLGMFITKNIVEAHGGKIWFESQEGQGTTFSFSLPLTNAVSS